MVPASLSFWQMPHAVLHMEGKWERRLLQTNSPLFCPILGRNQEKANTVYAGFLGLVLES